MSDANMQTHNQVIQFKPRPPKAATQRWIGPIEAERERCLTVCLHPAAQGNWSNAARVLLCETAMSAEAIIENLKSWRAESTAQLCADFAAGRFNTAGTI